jgi:hypothetical protein
MFAAGMDAARTPSGTKELPCYFLFMQKAGSISSNILNSQILRLPIGKFNQMS